MKRLMTRIMPYGRSLGLALVVSAALSAPDMAMAASGQDRAWTNVGSVGVVKDTDLTLVKLDGSRARLAAGTVSGTIRYNVTATEGLFLGPDKTLTVRFYKPDNFSVVTARLWSVDGTTGAHTTLMFFDSTPYAPVAGFQTQSVTVNLPSDFDFNDKAYFIEVVLYRTRNAQGTLFGDPRIELLKILAQ